MTEREDRELREYSSFLLKQFGFNIPYTDPVMPALFTIHREMTLAKQSNEKMIMSIQEAVCKMNPNVYHFNSPGEAWKFQLANSAKWLFVGLSVIILAWVCSKWWEKKNNLEKAQGIIQMSSSIQAAFLTRMQIDPDGFYYLDFEESKGQSVKSFTEYDRGSNGKVRVYLGRQK